MRKIYIITTLLLISVQGLTQRLDTLVTIRGEDTLYQVFENRLEQNKFLGNSWYGGIAYTRSRSNELSISFGRSYMKLKPTPVFIFYSMKSWGLEYSTIFKRGNNHNTIGVFGEWTPGTTLLGFNTRMNYIYDITTSNHYIRPSLGLSFLILDILYNYSFLIHGETNGYGHGIAVRMKFPFPTKKWEVSHVPVDSSGRY